MRALSTRNLSLLFGLLAYPFVLYGQLTNLLKDPDARGTHPSEQTLFAKSDRYLDSLRNNDLLYEDSLLMAFLYEITDRLLPGKRADIPWEIHLTTQLSPNAFAAADGRIYVTAGMIARLDHEAQLAFILAHELAHYVFRHGAARMEFEDGLSRLSTSQQNRKRGRLSQQHEKDADEIGALLYAQAGYPLDQLDEALSRLQSELNYGGMMRFIFGVSDITRSHPRTPERIAHLNAFKDSLSFNESYELQNDFQQITYRIRRDARIQLAGGTTSEASYPYRIRMIDSLLSYLPEDEQDDPFVWDMRLSRANAQLKLLLLSRQSANTMMVMDRQLAEREAKGSREELRAIDQWRLGRNKADYPEMIADVARNFDLSLKSLRTYPPHASEADRLEGSQYYHGKRYAEALPLLKNYLATAEDPINERLIRKMIRTAEKESSGKKRRRSN